MALTIRASFKEDAAWVAISNQGLHGKMQTGITQIYWQWQSQGRTNSIEYKPENVSQTFVINMTNDGLPLIERSQQGCLEFLYWFVDKKFLNKSVNVTTTFIEKRFDEVGDQSSNIALSEESAATSSLQKRDISGDLQAEFCNFQYGTKVHIYNLNSGTLTFSD
jgi:hypothetical protein